MLKKLNLYDLFAQQSGLVLLAIKEFTMDLNENLINELFLLRQSMQRIADALENIDEKLEDLILTDEFVLSEISEMVDFDDEDLDEFEDEDFEDEEEEEAQG